MSPRAKFHMMTEGTRDDWQVIATCAADHNQKLPDRILEHLNLLGADDGGFAVSRLEHVLQTATLAHRDGRDEEYVVCALLHDIGDTLGSYNHADIAGAILKPFVSEEHLFMVEKHAIFQGYYFFEHLGLDKNMRDQFRDHPHYKITAQFCALYDQRAFDPEYKSMQLEEFEPMLRRVLARPVRSIYLKKTE
jgi:predicted HD phosphohydrolase